MLLEYEFYPIRIFNILAHLLQIQQLCICANKKESRKNLQDSIYKFRFNFYKRECLVITAGFSIPIKSKIVGAKSPKTPS